MIYRFPKWKDASWNSFERQRERYEAIRPFLRRDQVGAELGVYKGGFGEFLLGHCRKLYLVDTWYRAGGFWKDRPGDSRVDAVIAILSAYKAEIEAGRVEVVVERADRFLWSMPVRHFDWVYLDTGHEFRSTLVELALAQVKTKPGGHIFGDDYDPDPTSRQHGVFRAVNQHAGETGAELVLSAGRQWALRVPDGPGGREA